MKKLVLLIILGSSIASYAQDPEDALRLTWFHPSGTARSNALSGAMGTLGGDLSANHINPAGLGMYKSSEILLTPKFLVQTNDFKYRGTNSSSNDNKSSFGSIGIVLADGLKKNNWTSTAFSISFNQVADFSNHIRFNGLNNFSSYAEKYLEELIRDGADTNSALNNYIFGSSLAYRTYLIDTTANASGAVTGYQSLVPNSSGLNQTYDLLTSGSYNELAFGWGGTMADKLYLGASFVMPMINYSKSFYYSETDASNSTNNDFDRFSLHESFNSKGWGIGAKFGVIYKPESYFRIGFALHTPQLISFIDRLSVDMTTNTEKYAGTQTASSNELNNGYPGEREYTVATPLKTIFSSSYFFAAPSKPSQPLGFISADVEWVNYAGTRFYGNTYDDVTTEYYNALNNTIKSIYKNNLNIKIGSEIKLNGNWMLRAGTAYYGSPYKDEALKASRLVVSGGIGYRTNRHFIDFTIINSSTKDVVFPYRLNDKANTFANMTGNQMIFNIGYGIRFSK
ncbi:MAG: outer membrane protein transport protein [Bacteroidetes bacterium]|nr:outer membrane protein transport protein [Bacteroidota bacterium]